MIESDSKQFWRGQKVFITGINGFIGGNLAKSLVENDAHVVGLIRNEDRNSFLFYEGVSDRCTLIRGDLGDKELLSRIISEQQIAIVFHLAAQVEVGVALANPYLTFETNVRGTYTLLDAIRQYSKCVRAVVIASSDKAYGSYPRDQMPYREDFPLRPCYPYDTSKAVADMIAQSYANKLYKLPVVVTRFSNIYGPGQLNFSAVVADAITSALKYSKFIPRGDGRQVRDFIFVEDVVDLYLRIANRLAANPEKYRGEVFNAGTNTPHTIRDLVEQIYELCGNKPDFDTVLALMKGKETVGEIDYQFMDFKKVNQFFDWSPQHRMQDGLTKTIEWYKDYHRKREIENKQKLHRRADWSAGRE